MTHTQIPEEAKDLRLDKALAQLFPEYSRSQLQAWIREGRVMLNGRQPRPRDRVYGGEQVALEVSLSPQTEVEAQNIPLEWIYKDAHLLVVHKPAGLVVHPAAGHPNGTLQNGLLYHVPELRGLPRTGLVHRLDKNTSGLLIVARSLEAYHSLTSQLQARSLEREYRALVLGTPVAGSTIDACIGRHLADRKRMAVRSEGRTAITHYRVMQRFRAHTLLSVQLETGRTHQIRVHMAHIHLPIVGDPVYGGRNRLPSRASPKVLAALASFRRQALHATRLAVQHPKKGERMEWHAPLPKDMQTLIDILTEE